MTNSPDSKVFDLTIHTPDDVLVRGKIKSILIPSIQGPFQVLYSHAPIIAAMDNGVIKLVADNDLEWHYLVKGGIAEVHHNKVTIAVENIEKI